MLEMIFKSVMFITKNISVISRCLCCCKKLEWKEPCLNIVVSDKAEGAGTVD